MKYRELPIAFSQTAMLVWGEYCPRQDGWWLPAEDWCWEREDAEAVRFVRHWAGWVFRDFTLWHRKTLDSAWQRGDFWSTPALPGAPVAAPPPALMHESYRLYNGHCFYLAEELKHAEKDVRPDRENRGQSDDRDARP